MKIEMIDAQNPQSEVIKQAAAILAGGGVIVAPTETRYGLLGRADQEHVLKRIFNIKGRDASKPVAVFLPDKNQIDYYAELNAPAKKLSEKFLPGPLTLVLKAKDLKSSGLVMKGRIGIRVSSSPVISQLLAQTGKPLCATSANISGEESGETVHAISRKLRDEVDLYLDGGKLCGPASTVVDLSADIPVVLRTGAIDQKEIETACK